MWVLTLALAGGWAGTQIRSLTIRLSYPGEVSFIEGMRLAEIVRLRQGVPIYAPASAESFDAAIYGPFYYLLGSVVVAPTQPSYFPLRVLSVLATLGCSGLAAFLVFSLARSRWAAALAPLIFLGFSQVAWYGMAVRPDSLALFLTFAGYVTAWQFRGSRRILLAAPLMLLGLFVKQIFIAAPLAVLFFLLGERKYQRAAVWAGVMTLGSLGLLAYFHYFAFPGQAFLQHFFTYNMLRMTLAQFMNEMIVAGLIFFGPTFLAFKYLDLYPDRLLACYLGCALAVAILASGKEGSDINYFVECVLITSVLIPAFLAKMIARPARVLRVLIVLAVALFMARVFTPPLPRKGDFSRDLALQAFLRGNFTSSSRGLGYYTGDLLRAGLQTPISDPYQYVQLVRQGTFSDRDLVRELERQKFDVIIVNFDLQLAEDRECMARSITDGMRGVILERYRLATTLELPGPELFHPDDRFYAWVPRPRASSGAPKSSTSPSADHAR